MTELSTLESSILVFFTQVAFLLLRTINIKFTARDHTFLAVITSLSVGVCWLIAIAIGVDSLYNFSEKWPVTVSHLSGGTLGTYLGMIMKRKGGIK